MMEIDLHVFIGVMVMVLGIFLILNCWKKL